MDEPESLGALGVAAREELDNLTFVVNCNLQRLDGPVRGNGKIIQELESFFRGAGWNVIKVIWGREWDPLLAADTDGALVELMNTTPDGDFQTYKAESGAFVREHFFGRDPRTAAMVEHLSDAEIWGLKRGGHDYRKLYAAYHAATEHTGQPTVILAKTIKGWTLGSHFESRNSTHQMKKLTARDLQGLPGPALPRHPRRALDETLPPYYRPARRLAESWSTCTSGGAPSAGTCPPAAYAASRCRCPATAAYAVADRGSGRQAGRHHDGVRPAAQGPDEGPRDRAPVRADHPRRGPHLRAGCPVPVKKIYSPHGQHYLSVDRDLMLSYQEDTAGRPAARGHHRGRLRRVLDRGRHRRTPPTANR